MRITHPRVLYAPDEPPAGGATDESDPSPEPAPAAEQAPPAPAPGPWADDLASAFADEIVRAQVDGFLREKVQPRVTELEQATAGNRRANDLYQDFSDKPVETFVTVASELFDEDVTGAIVKVLRGEAPAEDDLDLSELDDDDVAQLPAEEQEAIAWARDKQREEAYASELERVGKANPDVEIDEELFHPFVVAAGGDFDTAIGGYAKFVEQAKSKYGVNVPDPEAVPAPPNVIDASRQSPSTPPVQEEYGTIDDAIDAFFEEQKSPPPVVGAS